MDISSEELTAQGFWRAGTVYPDAATTLRVQIDRDARGFVVYAMVVDHEFMKAGKTETPLGTRMRGTFGALRRKMGDRASHPRYQEKTFKEHAQAAIRAGQEVELWAKEHLPRGHDGQGVRAQQQVPGGLDKGRPASNEGAALGEQRWIEGSGLRSLGGASWRPFATGGRAVS